MNRRMINSLLESVRVELGVPEIEQYPNMCGLASLEAVLRYWGYTITQDTLAAGSGWTAADGILPEDLVQVARRLGFRARAWEATIDDLQRLVARGIPVIVDWFSVDEGHYAVVVGFDEAGVRLMDPEFGGDRTIDTASFKRRWFDFDDLAAKKGLVRHLAIVVTPSNPTKG